MGQRNRQPFVTAPIRAETNSDSPIARIVAAGSLVPCLTIGVQSTTGALDPRCKSLVLSGPPRPKHAKLREPAFKGEIPAPRRITCSLDLGTIMAKTRLRVKQHAFIHYLVCLRQVEFDAEGRSKAPQGS